MLNLGLGISSIFLASSFSCELLRGSFLFIVFYFWSLPPLEVVSFFFYNYFFIFCLIISYYLRVSLILYSFQTFIFLMLSINSLHPYLYETVTYSRVFISTFSSSFYSTSSSYFSGDFSLDFVSLLNELLELILLELSWLLGSGDPSLKVTFFFIALGTGLSIYLTTTFYSILGSGFGLGGGGGGILIGAALTN